MSKFIIGAAAFLALALSVFGLVGGNQSGPKLGGVTNLDSITITPTAFTEGLKVGTSSASNLNNIISGTCALTGMDISQTASTTAPYDCAVTGVISGDKVFAQISTSTIGIGNGWAVTGTKASTTAGFITLLISNLSGANRVPSATGVGSTTQYLVIR